MNQREKLRRIRRYPTRRQRFDDAVRKGARRVPGEPVREQQTCAMCLRPEVGGLDVYRRRDGQELLVGDRCGQYLDYLAKHPEKVAQLTRKPTDKGKAATKGDHRGRQGRRTRP